MRPNQTFLKQPKSFWAAVRLISQDRYTLSGEILVPNPKQMAAALEKSGLDPTIVMRSEALGARQGELLEKYFSYRAKVLHELVKPALMNAAEAKREFEMLKKRFRPKCPIPSNKQRGEKKAPAYFTGIINILLEANLGLGACDFDPRKLTSFTLDEKPVRTLSRRVDGAFPSVLNPVAIWEIKEYYYTTTFGSRVADGVYESLLDGMELEELREHEGIDCLHYLMIDAYKTWWEDGKSYLCRIVDMLHMGYVDEVLFGREAIERIPSLAREWLSRA